MRENISEKNQIASLQNKHNDLSYSKVSRLQKSRKDIKLKTTDDTEGKLFLYIEDTIRTTRKT